MQQKVVGLCGVAVPIGWPPVGAQLPPVGVVNVPLRAPTPGLPLTLTQAPAWLVRLRVADGLPTQALAWYQLIVPEQVALAAPPQAQSEHARVSDALV